MNIVVFFTSVNGVKTFVTNLVYGLQQNGYPVNLYKLGRTTENCYRKYAGGVMYRNMSEDDIMKLPSQGPTLLATTAPKFAEQAEMLVSKGARVVIHSSSKGDLACVGNTPLLIRSALKKFVPGGKVMKHPYVSRFSRKAIKPKYAICPTRLCGVKNTPIVLEAINNGANIDLYGDLMPFYGMYLDKNFSGWRKIWKGAYPADSGFRLIAPYRFMIDLTTLPNDGGAVQYSFLEAMDAGAIPVIHSDWAWGDMRDGKNCIAVSGWEELMKLKYNRMDFSKTLAKFDAKRVAKLWWREVCL